MLNVVGATYDHFDYDDPFSLHEITETQIPADPAPDQVLVRMLLAPVHPCDIWCARGTINGVKLPAYGGVEGVAVVEKIGADLKAKFTEGMRVHVSACNLLGEWDTWQGTWRTHILCPENALIPVPDGVSDEVAAQFYVNPLTCMAFRDTMGIGEGNVLIQNAAASVVGKTMNQLGGIYGYDTINIVRREASRQELIDELGAKYAFVYDGSEGSFERVKEEIRAAMDGRIIDHCIEAVGTDNARLCLDLLGPNGHLYAYGVLTDDMTYPIISIPDLMMKNNVIHGWSTQETWLRQTPEDKKRAVMDELWGLLKSGRLTLPPIKGRYSLQDVNKAVKGFDQPRSPGKLMIDFSL